MAMIWKHWTRTLSRNVSYDPCVADVSLQLSLQMVIMFSVLSLGKQQSMFVCFFSIFLVVKLDRLTLKVPKKVPRNMRGSFYCVLSPTVVFTGRCGICSPVTLQWLGSKTRGTIQNKALSSASEVQLNLKSLLEINSEIAVVKENTLALGCANVFLKANLERTHRRERLSSFLSYSYMYSEYIYTPVQHHLVCYPCSSQWCKELK